MSKPAAPSERLLYPRSALTDPNLSMESPLRGSTVNEQSMKDQIPANKNLILKLKLKNILEIIMKLKLITIIRS